VRRLLLAAAAAAALASVPPAATAADRVAFARAGELFAAGGGAPTVRLTRDGWPDSRPAWSPDGLRLAFVRDRGAGPSLHVMNADGSGVRLLAEGGFASASWAPDGRTLVAARAGARGFALVLVDAASGRVRPLPSGVAQAADPAWSPDGTRIAYAGDGGDGFDLWVVRPDGTGRVRLTHDGAGNVAPAWSPSGRLLAFASLRRGVPGVFSVPAAGGSPRRLFRGEAETPSWSPGGRRIVFASAGRLVTVAAGGGDARRLGPPGAAQPAWGARPDGELRLPDVDQLTPAGLVLSRAGTRLRLGFDGASANLGRGPLHVRGERPSAAEPMLAAQVVHLPRGGRATHEHAGVVRYTTAHGHSHWHLMRFMSYELRTLDGTVLARDRKAGFCLGDRRGRALPGRHARAAFGGFCSSGEPDALGVEMGTSVGWVDLYRAYYHGQYVDVTGVPDGDYVLVHRANASRMLLERDYDNNAASARIRLRTGDAPSVRILRRCRDSERC
jgi:hypothetical protein